MKKIILATVAIFTLYLSSMDGNAQASCTGSMTIAAGNCSAITIGNGTAGSIKICLTSNGIGSNMCTPGGSCNPPYSGGGWAERFAIYASDGTTYTGGSLANWTSGTANGTCFTLTTTNGYATIFGLCINSSTSFSWTTVDACGNQVCTGTPPPCGGPVCTTCASACATCGFSTSPTVAQVTSSCPDYPYNPPLATGQSATRCHTFQAINTTVSFNVIISSNCSGGNVSAFSWTLQQSSCGGVLQSGTLASLSFTGLTIGAQYTFCYTFTVPNPGPPTNSCTHTTHYPYFVGAATLPVELISFDALPLGKEVSLTWATAAEINNDFFTIEKSVNGVDYEVVSRVKGGGNSTNVLFYKAVDTKPFSGLSYYRLKQTDFDGKFKYSNLVSVTFEDDKDIFSIKPNPTTSSADIHYKCNSNESVNLNIYDRNGSVVFSKEVYCEKGGNTIDLLLNDQPSGIYFITLTSHDKIYKSKLIKN